MNAENIKSIKLTDIFALEQQEKQISDFVESYLTDECGLLLCHLNINTLKPWSNDELSKFDLAPLILKNCSGPAGYMSYEDSLMATGEYALSQIIKYEATAFSPALVTAGHQIFAILRVLFEGERYEKGFLPKPHGGMRNCGYSHEISPDQQIKSLVALRAYQKYCPASLSRTIDNYIVAIADYHTARNFIHPRRESFVVTPENRPHHLSILIPVLWLAHKITGKKSYKESLGRFDAVLDYLAQGKSGTDLDIASFNIASLLFDGFHLAMQEGLDDRRLKETIRQFWLLNLPFVREDGYGSIEGKRTSRVLRLSSMAPIVDQYFPETEAYKLGIWLMQKINTPPDMLYETAKSEIHPSRYNMTESVCETSVTSWLLAYWRLVQSAKR